MSYPVHLAGAWVLLALLSAAVHAADPLTLAEAQRIAENRSARIEEFAAQEQASREMAVAAGQLPDPVVKLGVTNVPVSGEAGWSLNQEAMTMRSVSLMQEFTRSEKREARTLRASREAELARANQRQTLADLRRDTALDWLDAAYLGSLCDLLETQGHELDLQLQASEAAFRAGRGEQADVFATRLAIARNRDQLAQMQRDRAMARERLARWVGDAAQRPLGDVPESREANWQAASFLDHAAMHPTLAATTVQVSLAEAEARLAKANRTPDLSVELMYNQRGPSYANMVSLAVSMPLQWDRGQRQDRELAAKLALLDQARAQQEDMRRSYVAMLRETLVAWQAGRDRLKQYDESLIPLGLQQITAAESAYRAGSGSLTRALEARRMNIETRMERQRIALETARAWAQLNFLDPQGKPDATAQGVQP